ncbi:hypothetical protein SCE1572_44165 [Sorangium cellulosum So0157-2]|uniref:Uncharacterized protein n=1 Tax=Sorangium cellulosum So0157-2 TaxID=1254432 RepID=S4Y977_SORCE|nr:hypothetical protein SCE1572_44165 [Sorangium cellulosum So0157-2]
MAKAAIVSARSFGALPGASIRLNSVTESSPSRSLFSIGSEVTARC